MGMPTQQIQQKAVAGIDATAVMVAGASFMDYLPPIAAVLSILWLGMQMIVFWPKVKERLKEIFGKGDK